MNSTTTFPQLFQDKSKNSNLNKFSMTNINEIVLLKRIINGREINNKREVMVDSIIKLVKSYISNKTKNENDKIELISKFLLQTQLLKKLKLEMKNDNKKTFANICNSCATLLQFEQIKKGHILFRINDTSTKCYFLINGCVSVLNQKYINNVLMTSFQYLHYLFYLKHHKETYILNDIIRKNYFNFPIDNIEDIRKISLFAFLIEVNSHILNETFDIDILKKLMQDYNQHYDSFNISLQDIQVLWNRKKINIKNSKEKWDKYLNDHFVLPDNEIHLFNKYFNILKEKGEKKWTCSQYEIYQQYGQGAFFGEPLNDSVDNRRNSTIIADDDCILGYLTYEDYFSIFAPKKSKERPKELYFLYDNYFFRAISLYVFEKNYYQFFNQINCIKEQVVYSNGIEPNELYFLKEGRVEITIQCSVIDLHNLIKYLIDQITALPLFCEGTIRYPPIMSKEKIDDLKAFLQDSILFKLKSQINELINNMNKIQVFHLFYLSENETLGIEEIILQIPYLTNSKVVSVNASLFKIPKKKLIDILSEEQPSFYLYTKLAANKIVSLIERLYYLKKNIIDMALFKVHQHEENIKLNNPYKSKNIEIHKDLIPLLPKPISYKHKIKMILNKNIEEKNWKYLSHSHISNKQSQRDINTNNNDLNLKRNTIENDNDGLDFNINQLDKGTYVNFDSQYVSIPNLKKDVTKFSSIDDSKRYVKLVMKPTDFDMLNNDTSIYDYYKYPKKLADKIYKSMSVNELVTSNFHMSLVNLLNSKNESLANTRNYKAFKNGSYTERSKFTNSLIDNEKIPFIAHYKKSHARNKVITRNSSSLHSIGTLRDYIPIRTKSLELETKSIQNPNVINDIVKEYYDLIKKSGYSILAKRPHNSYFKQRDIHLQNNKYRKRFHNITNNKTFKILLN